MSVILVAEKFGTIQCFFSSNFQVRTKDRTFDSVSHLINYHRDNALPIISAESALRLKKPVLSSQQASLPKAVVGNLHFR